ncbi:hypothetical protein OJQ59_000511 [Escherichia coli]
MGNSDHQYDGVYQSLVSRAYYRLEGEHVMMRSRQFEPWHETVLPVTAKEVITMFNTDIGARLAILSSGCLKRAVK